jgi:hypothetical protein
MGKCWFMLWPSGLFYRHLGYFMIIWNMLCSFGRFFRFWYHVPRKIWQPWPVLREWTQSFGIGVGSNWNCFFFLPVQKNLPKIEYYSYGKGSMLWSQFSAIFHNFRASVHRTLFDKFEKKLINQRWVTQCKKKSLLWHFSNLLPTVHGRQIRYSIQKLNCMFK